MARKLAVASLSLALLVGCNFGIKNNGDDTTDDTATGDDTDVDNGTSIADVKTSGQTEGSVTFTGVIATTGLNRDGEGFFIQDAGGGPWGAIYCYLPFDTADLYIEVGDKLTVTGELTDFYGWLELTVSSGTAIQPTGTGEVTVSAVDPAGVNDWEQWESQLIEVGAATVTEGPNRYNEALLNNGLRIDDLVWTYVDEYPSRQGSSFTNVRGVLSYSFETWKLNPRAAGDLEGYVPGEGPEAITIAEVQQGAVTDGGAVALSGAVVTSGLIGAGTGFFLSDVAGGPWSGIYAFVPNWSGAALPVGTVVDVEATYTEYYDLSELTYVTVTPTGGTTTPPAPIDLNAPPSEWEPYEGVEVRLHNLVVTAEADYGEVETNFGINIDDLFFEVPAAANDTFTSVTGHITYAFGEYKIVPDETTDYAQ